MAIVTKNWISCLKLEMQTSKHVEYIVVVANTGLSCVTQGHMQQGVIDICGIGRDINQWDS